METYSNCCGADMIKLAANGHGRCPECKEGCTVIEDDYNPNEDEEKENN